jgi:DUF4097 and DUF4098 domain-containing protein YvlB
MNERYSSIRAFSIIIVLVLVTPAVFCAPRGEAETHSRSLTSFDSFTLSASSLAIEVFETQGQPLLETTLNSRRKLTVRENAGRLTVEVSKIWRIISPRIPEVIKLYVPSGTITTAEVETSSGSIRITDIEFTNLDVGAHSGSIHISRCDGAIEIETKSGSVSLDEFSGAVDITTKSGSILGERVFVRGDSSLTSKSGSIEFSFLNPQDDLAFDLEAGSGSIRVGDIRGADRVVYGAGGIKITGRSRSGNQKYMYKQ